MIAGEYLTKEIHIYRFSLPNKQTYENQSTRSIWWGGKRHLVPLLDLVNCLDSSNDLVEAHQTSLEGHYAVTNATSVYKRGQQVFENYAQPNYIYFMHHGFILEQNSHDCALFKDLSISKSDLGTRTVEEIRSRLIRTGFPTASFNPTFCIKDSSSLDSVANFVRIKLGKEGGDSRGMGRDVEDFIRQALKKRIERYKAVEANVLGCVEKKLPKISETMLSIVKSEQSFFEAAYNEL